VRSFVPKLMKLVVALLVVSLLYLQFGPQESIQYETGVIPRGAPLYLGVLGYVLVVYAGIPVLKEALVERRQVGCFLFGVSVAYSARYVMAGIGLIGYAVYTLLLLTRPR